VSAHHQRLDRKQQGLDAQQHRVNDAHGASTACNAKRLNAPVSFEAIKSWLLV
jgi:hypothetical protein